MKIHNISRLIYSEYKRNILACLISIIIFDYIYIKFIGLNITPENSYISWIGYSEVLSQSLSSILLKLFNISMVFVAVFKIMEKMKENIIIYMLSRVSSYKSFVRKFTYIVILLGTSLVFISHLLYYILAGISFEHIDMIFLYLFFDILGFIGISLVYIIINNIFELENSIIYIIAIYVINTISPIPILIGTTTIQFANLFNKIGYFIFFILIGLDILLIFCYEWFLKKRRVIIC